MTSLAGSPRAALHDAKPRIYDRSIDAAILHADAHHRSWIARIRLRVIGRPSPPRSAQLIIDLGSSESAFASLTRAPSQRIVQ
jgi:hypothetical protein